MKEIWKVILENDNYQISNLGRVKNKKGHILTPHPNNDGYLKVHLYREGRPKEYRIHRLVGVYFVKNPKGKPEINHLDGIKENNLYTNLEWCTRSENVKHAYSIGLKCRKGKNNPMYGREVSEKTRKLRSINATGENSHKFRGYYKTPFGTFESSREAGKAEGCSHSAILYKIKSKKHVDYFISKEK